MDETERLTALVHLYRGELGRMTAYRARLDTTTNWAVGTTAALGSFGLCANSSPHLLLLPLVLLLLFLWMESRRYLTFRLLLERVRLLETGLYLPVLGETGREDWKQRLGSSLRAPTRSLALWQAIGIRLRRNYLGLVVVLVASWAAKAAATGSLLQGARAGWVPGGIVVSVIALGSTGLAALAVVAPRHVEEG